MTLSRETIAAVRFGYGSRAGEPPAEQERMLAGVRRGARRARKVESTLPQRLDDFARFAQLRKSQGPDGPGEELRAARRVVAARRLEDSAGRVRRAVLSEDGFYERLVWFWADHFTISARNVRDRAIAPTFEIDAIRPHVAGSFAALLRASVLHPVMLVYLNQARSTGPGSPIGMKRGIGLNENLAREALELHTLGAGADYGQRDVREFAELLTGLIVNRREGATAFRPGMAEPGAEVVLGQSYGGGARARREDIDAALEDLAAHPATARHIARKLAVHFVADEPDEGLVAHVEAAFRQSGGDLMAVYAALLEHPASWQGLGAKVRQPFDFVVASLRATGAEDLPALGDGRKLDPTAALGRMNQPLWGAPGPDGWPEAAEAWISPPGLTARIDWASRLGVAVARRTDPREFVETALGELARDETRFAASVAAERWEGIALVLASPEFNRR